jgi:hypothetical protein
MFGDRVARMSEQLQISFDEGRRLAVIMRDQQVPEPIEGHPGLCWIEGILTTQDDDPELIKEATRQVERALKREGLM